MHRRQELSLRGSFRGSTARCIALSACLGCGPRVLLEVFITPRHRGNMSPLRYNVLCKKDKPSTTPFICSNASTRDNRECTDWHFKWLDHLVPLKCQPFYDATSGNQDKSYKQHVVHRKQTAMGFRCVLGSITNSKPGVFVCSLQSWPGLQQGCGGAGGGITSQQPPHPFLTCTTCLQSTIVLSFSAHTFRRRH